MVKPNFPYTAYINNKDHQKMIVNPMFMIAQSWRSFLAAVTPTAVITTVFTPTAVIPTAVAPIAVTWICLNLSEFTWIYLTFNLPEFTILVQVGSVGFFCIHWSSLGFTWIYLGSLGFTWVYLGLLKFTLVHLGSLGFTWVHLGHLVFTWVHFGSLGFTWVQLGSVGFLWVPLVSLVFTLVHFGSLGFTSVHLGSLGLIWLDLGYLDQYRSYWRHKKATYRQTHTLRISPMNWDAIESNNMEVIFTQGQIIWGNITKNKTTKTIFNNVKIMRGLISRVWMRYRKIIGWI